MYDSTNYPNLGKNLGVCDSLSLFLYFHASYLLKSIPTWYEQVRTLKVLQAPKGGNVLAHESICSLYLKYILEIFWHAKKIETKKCIHLHAHKVVSWKFDLACVKKTIFGAKYKTFQKKMCFLHRAQKISVFHETWRMHIYCGNVHVEFFVKNFRHFKIFFFGKGSICTHEPETNFRYKTNLLKATNFELNPFSISHTLLHFESRLPCPSTSLYPLRRRCRMEWGRVEWLDCTG
jgi:hypothetical protein